MRRFFVPLSAIHGDKVYLRGSDIHHLLHVLRKKVGDTFEATDGHNRKLLLKIQSITQEGVVCLIQQAHYHHERSLSLRLFQVLPRTPAWEDILTRACELGVTEIVPLLSERTLYPAESAGTRKPRWQRLVEETTKKTGRLSLMTLHPILLWKEVPSLLKEHSLKIMPWEGEKTQSLRSFLERQEHVEMVELLIGPEGGFAWGEVEEARTWGFHTVSLGERILTTSTAVIVTLANIYYSLDREENSHPQ
ncbi:MAG: 16S rRNA (uracil(1498)-N(3))-methyltransferase [Brevinematales bacterium]|nr:16S rRNA (uracil(1498)-N(3))-methyltransferase [Brevinematales bacterium]